MSTLRRPARSMTLPMAIAGALLALLVLCLAPVAGASGNQHHGPSIVVDLPVATQGPLWPPADMTDANGDFPVIGFVLADIGLPFPGVFIGEPFLVSKDTVPPMDENGNRILNDWFLTHYDLIRPLDLSPGSPDLDIVLHALSIGPPDESGVARIPREGDSAFNLSTDAHPCQEIFPTAAQRAVYTRPRLPLHEIPIYGFQGDQVAYDIISGAPFTPNHQSGEGCGTGCPGEDVLDYRPVREPITLGDWIRARGKVKIQLTDFDSTAGGYTAAEFEFRLRRMIPNSVYTVWTIRPRRVPGSEFLPQADPLGLPNIIVTDDRGNARQTLKEIHPFPDFAGPDSVNRVVGVIVAYHADYQNWGACGGRLGNGVDIQTHLNSVILDNLDISDGMITVPPSGP